MSSFLFETITSAEAANYNAAADTLTFAGANGALITAAYIAAAGATPEHVAVTFGPRSVDFGTGIYGDQDIRLSDGSMFYVGGAGPDAASGTTFGDALYGGQGADSLTGGDGRDLLQGNQGADLLAGGLGNDAIFGGQDNDSISLGDASSPPSETNWTNGNKGEDVIVGAAGSDTILGGQGSDLVSGAGGDDLLLGNLGDDTINGDDGADVLIGEGGVDVLNGGGGADVFVFGPGSSSAADRTLVDQIFDWSALDRIHIDGAALGYTEVAPTTMMGGYGYGGYDYGGGTGYAAMLSLANNQMAAYPGIDIVAAQVDADVVVFVDSDGDDVADLGILLSGASLADISASNFF